MPQPAALRPAVVKAGSSSEFSPSALIEPSAGCSYRSAIFDGEGILAFESCSELGPHGEVVTEPAQGYLVQLNDTHEVVHRLPLETDGCPCSVASDPQTGTILVRHDHWLWEYHGGNLRLIKHYTLPERGFDETPILIGHGS